MKLAICNVCGGCFIPEKGYEKTCNECFFKARRAKPVFCEIEEAYGRCDGYMKGICEVCLDFCAAQDWVGWRAVNGCEWWKNNSMDRGISTGQSENMGTTGCQNGQSYGSSISQETYSGMCWSA